jgi:hypothetical protein
VPTATETPTASQDLGALDSSEYPLEHIAFSHLLEEHPRRLTLAQLAREIGGDRVALGRAIANLSEVFLIQSQDGELIPSPLAVRVDQAG